jgi:hypothetical protein
MCFLNGSASMSSTVAVAFDMNACVLIRIFQDMGPLATSLPPKKFFGRFICFHHLEAPAAVLSAFSVHAALCRFDPDFLEERRKGLDSCVRARESHLRALSPPSQAINASLTRSRYLKQTIDQCSPSQLTALMKFLQPFDESSGGRCSFFLTGFLQQNLTR